MTSPEPIAIVGSACRFPGDCITPSKLWELLIAPRDLRRRTPDDRYNVDAFYHPDPKHHGTTDVRESYFLNDDITVFDNAFFHIPAGEAEAIDPQQRLLMETVYDSLCAAGLTLEELRGSATGIYVGVMCDDWSAIATKDMDLVPQYVATGMARSIMSNRISYFFDWHGPSMTIDTACSSSLVAVHQAIEVLRSGECQVAIAAGTNLILSPHMYIAESKLSMLSPSGTSRMWDKDADGYARGEGIAAVVLKPLSAALRDNDHIECLIRATGINQDGRTPGLTVPSATAQAHLIQATYTRANLDLDKVEDRPQFFHAHGTGTPAGDPEEAEAIWRAFCSTTPPGSNKLYVGSIKTIIGHTEGTAGLASLISTSNALQHGMIPPNLHFHSLNPRITQFYDTLEVPVTTHQWPALLPGQPRRASINSFGFGGTNAHAILEAYERPCVPNIPGPLVTPLTFSAASETSLRSSLSRYTAYLEKNPTTNLHDLAYSLQTRRSTLSYRVALTAKTVSDALFQLRNVETSEPDISTRATYTGKQAARILGVFTGQGAQWARMGAKLLEISPFVADRISELDHALAQLDNGLRPEWTLRDMILADEGSSRIIEAAVSQPVCTALQIVQVDLLRLAGVTLIAVVGHSSGEIAAAYAAGFVTCSDAIKIAYLRGYHASLARSPMGATGAMMAVGTTIDDAVELCNLSAFKGRIQLAAHNSPSSVTLSGDEDAILEAMAVFQDEGKFARQLHVDTAYHSCHVRPCAEPYLAAMEESLSQDGSIPTGSKWYSSVHEGAIQDPTAGVKPQYWVDNMTSPVLFSSAVSRACSENGPFDLALEIGPHPALQKPCLDTIEEVCGGCCPYSGLLARGKDDVRQLSGALGFVWTHLGTGSVRFSEFTSAVLRSDLMPQFLHDLPTYSFDHSRRFIKLSRVSGLYKSSEDTPNPVLGRRCCDRETSHVLQWRNILRPREISWLAGHRIQGQIVFPATGYIAMALESVPLARPSMTVRLLTIEDLQFSRALGFTDEDSSVETIFELRIVRETSSELSAEFTCTSGAPYDHRSPLAPNASGRLVVEFGTPSLDHLPHSAEPSDPSMEAIETDRFYDYLAQTGYHYSPPFRGTTSIRRMAECAIGDISDEGGMEWEDQLIVHPGVLDTALQTVFAAFCCPGDDRLWTLHIPTGLQSIVINPYFTPLGAGKHTSLQYLTVARGAGPGKVVADVDLLTRDPRHTFVQIQGLHLTPLSPAVPSDDAVLFSQFQYLSANPDGDAAAAGESLPPHDLTLLLDMERIAFYYTRQVLANVTDEERATTLPHYRILLKWAQHVVSRVQTGADPNIPASAIHDTRAEIDSLIERYDCDFPSGIGLLVSDLIARYHQRTDIRLIKSVGENLNQAIRDGTSILEHMTKDGMLDEVYEEGFGLIFANRHLCRVAAQIAHRYARMDIIEIGAGTGGSTRMILPALGDAFSTYTYTDISSAFFLAAQDRFDSYLDRMVFKTLDVSRDPSLQGFTLSAYDLAIASNVMHTTEDMETAVRHVRSLLKPGGYFLVLEVCHNDCSRYGLPFGGLPQWWSGHDSGRLWGPALSLPKWDSLLQRCGFAGIDTVTPLLHDILPTRVFCAQAIDDRVTMLRSPLSNISLLPVTKAAQLVIIGGQDLSTHRLSTELASLLGPRYAQTLRVSSLEEVDRHQLVSSCSVISLLDLDWPLFAAYTPKCHEGLKALWRQAGNILWLTAGSRENPHANMSLGLSRCMRFEYPNITLQTLDITNIKDRTPSLVAEHLLRLELLNQWRHSLRPEQLLWSLEPEIHVENSVSLIPRLYPYTDANNRYNSSRRVVQQLTNPQTTEYLLTSADGHLHVERPSPLCMTPKGPLLSVGAQTLRVTHFFGYMLRVAPRTRLMLAVGHDHEGKQYIALGPTMGSPINVPSEWCQLLPSATDPVQTLAIVAARIIALATIRSADPGDHLLIFNSPPILAATLDHLQKGISLIYWTDSEPVSASSGWQHLDARLPEREVKKLLRPLAITKYLDLSHLDGDNASGKLIARCLPIGCDALSLDCLIGACIQIDASAAIPTIGEMLAECSCNLTVDADFGTVPRVPIQAFSQNAGEVRPWFAIAECPQESIPAIVQSVDSGTLFQPDKTYLFVGLSGEIGQSLCRWMVRHGARYIVLTSRRPDVHPGFFTTMQDLGATVKVFSMDITKRTSLAECVNAIAQTLPPIAGVAHGAMVLQDTLFDSMSHETFARVVAPKAKGARNLDELFYDTPLDFMIFFSSLTYTLGNSGQSNYAAGNAYMIALAAKRRSRGLAASCINIGAIIGLGYVERADNATLEAILNQGYKPMSEQDLHQLFAEAIVVGRPGCPEPCELVSGIACVYNSNEAEAMSPHLRDIRLSHIMKHETRIGAHENTSISIPLRLQLAETKTADEALTIMTESFLARLRRILAVEKDEKLDADVTLVELGVDSLMAIEMRSWFTKELDLDIPVLKILGGHTVTELLCEALNLMPSLVLTEGPEGNLAEITQDVSKSGATSPGLPPSSDEVAGGDTPLTVSEPSSVLASSLDLKETVEEVVPMAFGQAAFWFLSQYIPNPHGLGMAAMMKLSGSISVDRLRTGVRRLAQRHEILRTRFVQEDGRDGIVPMQYIQSQPTLTLDVRSISSEGEADLELEKVHGREWDITSSDTAQISLLMLSDNTSFLLFGMHHIIMDGYSFTVLFKDLELAYSNQLLDAMSPSSQYRHFATNQRQKDTEGAYTIMVEYFRSVLPSDLSPIELLPLASVSHRPAIAQSSDHEAQVRVPASLAKRIQQLARQARCTTFHVYMATLQILLFRMLPSTTNLCIGMSDANRLDTQYLGTIGLFMNLLPIGLRRLEPGATALDYITTMRDSVYAAMQYSGFPFDVLVRELNVPRSTAHTPIFQVIVDYRPGLQAPTEWGGCKILRQEGRNASTGYDIALEVLEYAKTETLLTLRLQDSIYSQDSTDLFLRSYISVLESMVSKSAGSMEDIQLWSRQDVDEALEIGTPQSVPATWGPTILHRLDHIINTYGSRTALKDGNGACLTYQQLASRIDSIAAAILAADPDPAAVIGVFQQPSADWLCSLLAIMRVGAIYLPLDLRNSLPRLRIIVETARPAILLTDATTTDQTHLLGLETYAEVLVDSLPLASRPQNKQADAAAVAAILFTSGSTGDPKGIMLTHSNLVAHTEAWCKTRMEGIEPLVVLQQSPYSFDPSVHQVLVSLCQGGCLYVVPAAHRGDPAEIARIMVEEKVTYTLGTPSEYDLWLQYSTPILSRCSSWQQAYCGGEAMTQALARKFRSLELSHLRLFNCYGPAEVTLLTTSVEVDYRAPSISDPIPVGFMLSGCSVCIVDGGMKPVLTGVTGEIVLGGRGVSAGYLNDGKLTDRKFIEDELWDTPGKVYRTGDRGRLMADGTLFCYGRVDGDTQVKIRGFRVELTEVEEAIVRHSATALSHVVVTLRGSADARYLAAHVVFAAESSATAGNGHDMMINSWLQTLPLPPYMRPAVMIALERLPTTVHGKVNRKAVAAMPLPSAPPMLSDASSTLTDEQHRLGGLWRQVLPLEPGTLTPDCDFFVLGGNSILLVKLQSMIRERLRASLKLVTLMSASSLAAMANAIQISGIQNTIDWAEEIALTEPLRQAAAESGRPPCLKKSSSQLTVLLTGASGYLGRRLLSSLVADPRVSRVIALFRRPDEPGPMSSKASVYQADVSQPQLGLSQEDYDEVIQTVDVVVHCAANRSFWDPYQVLRPDNLDSVKELALLAIGRRAPLHFMSSGLLAPSYNPPQDGSDGYLASKWAAELFLQNAADALNLPVVIHRFGNLGHYHNHDPPVSAEQQAPLTQQTVLGHLSEIASRLGLRPSFDGVTGTIGIAPVERIITNLHESVLASVDGSLELERSVRHVDHFAELTVQAVDFSASFNAADALRLLPTVPVLEWVGKAKLAGLDFFIVSQTLTMGGKDGQLVSRR
ncbi:hypothetical protein BJY04DRAFT_219024 [Aspergillus karnatakaensis]|uniref:uncharacterized protein n=1 Tax=Aspergillus karnatakaensis TaxID=1810916 RepID=UPI003CCDDE6C